MHDYQTIKFANSCLTTIENHIIKYCSMVNSIYSSKLQLNKVNVSDADASFLDLHLTYRMVLSRLKFMINEMILILIL